MSQKVTASIPENMDLDANYIIRFTAVNASTGAALSTVSVSNAAILATNVKGGDLSSGLFEVELPTWINVPVPGEDTAP